MTLPGPPPPAKAADNQAQGMMIALLGFGCLTIGDGVIKSIAGEWPGTAVAALRYLIGTAGLLVILLAVEGRQGLRFPMPWAQVGRGVSVGIATIAFFSAIFLMPLADAVAIQFTSPMLTALLSALILGERLPRAAWPATLIAFAGMLLILRPNVADLGWAALLPVVAALGISAMMVFNRMVAGSGSVLLMQLLISAIAAPVIVLAAIIGHFSGFEALHVDTPCWSIVGRCAFVAVTATLSHLLIYLATTKASAAITAPMVYVQLLTAAIIGIVFFGDWPDPLALAGAALIIGAGLWLWWRERRRAKLLSPGAPA